MQLSSAPDELRRVRRPTLVVVLLFVAIAGAADVGFELIGAMRQIDGLVGATTGTTDSAVPAAPGESVRLVPPAPGIEAPVVTPDVDALESEPYLRFDADAAVREAADRDSSVAEFFNDPDPAVGSAVRDFITSLAPPGSH